MTEKQLRYICRLCPQTVEIGRLKGNKVKYVIKPDLMTKRFLTLPHKIAQLFIDYGKAWKNWCWYGDEICKYEYVEEHCFFTSYYEEIEDAKKAQDNASKEMKKIEKLLEKELDNINWGSYQDNLDINIKNL